MLRNEMQNDGVGERRPRYKSRLAARYRNINIFLIVFILIAVTAVCTVTVISFGDSASRDHVRFYAMESVGILGSYLERELSLVRHAAESREIIEWFADEGNQEKKAAAFHKMMIYAEMLKINSMYFAVLESLNEYSIESGAVFDEFLPFDVLEPADPVNQWFFTAINSSLDFELNLDVDKVSDTHRLWINHKVFENGDPVGVICAALQFEDVFLDLFSQYDSRNVIGYVIDDNGIIQIDSSEPEPDLMRYVEDTVDIRHILEIKSDPAFSNAINAYLDNPTTHDSQRAEPDIIKLSGVNYQYMSIAPIANTNWSTVTLYNSSALFDLSHFLLPVIAVIIAFFVYVMASSILNRRLVIMPLNKLTGSLSISDEKAIYGTSRDDEIGELARTTQTAIKSRERQTQILHAINTMAEALFSAEDEVAFVAALPEGIKHIADCMDLDRAYIWKNEMIEGSLHFVSTHEWVSDAGRKANPVPLGKVLSYEKDAPLWYETFLRNEYICGPIGEMTGNEAIILANAGVLSVLAIPVHLHGHFWGFVSFDSCFSERGFADEDIDNLRSGSLIITSAVNRNIQMAAIKEAIEKLEKRDKLMNTVNHVATILLSTELEQFTFDLHNGMGLIALAVNVARVRVWKNHSVDGKLHCTQIYEWSEGAEPQHGNEYTIDIPYDENMPGWEEVLSRGDCINNIVSEMSEAEQAQLSPQGILSLLVVPVFLKSEFWGFVGFDNCHYARLFTASEEVILRSSSLLVANSLIRQEMNQNLHDTTKELEAAVSEAHRANTSKSVFLAHMSHEIRTPMNSIIGFSELALDSDMTPKMRDYFTRILQNSEWLLQIINDILDISKIESGKMELENIPFDLGDMFAACRTLIMPKVLEKGLTMHFYAEPSVGKRLYGDPTRLRQVFVNLLTNAVKFTNSGMIKMQASMVELGKDSVTMRFEIKDSGIGITDEQLAIIFDPFTQAESGTTRKFGGTGLGLPITKSIIEIMGGSLAVESTPGIGSKFSFEITFDAEDIVGEDATARRIVISDLEKPTFEGEILLCEDNVMNQQVICEHLARVGLETFVAQNGKIGVEMVAHRMGEGRKQFDLIFMDIHMPVMDGIEAAKKIIELDTGVPIVAMTANVMTSDRDVYMDIGMDGCMGKPFTSQELWRCLMKFLKPVTWMKVDAEKREIADVELRRKLISNFVKSNRNMHYEIIDAINDGDIMLAHRLAHTIKGNAGQLNKTLLQEAAREIEAGLENGENLVTSKQLEVFKTELTAVLNEFAQMVQETEQPIVQEFMDAANANELLDELESLLREGDPECLSFVDDLRSIPGSESLIHQIEDFDFGSALISLAELRDK